MPSPSLSLTQSQRQEQVLSVQMIQKMALLTLPITELQQKIQKEIEENPALEIPEQSIIDSRFTEDVPYQEKSRSDEIENSDYDDFDNADYDTKYDFSSGDYDNEASDRKSAFIENTANFGQSLNDYLLDQLNASKIDDALFDVASSIISSLDDNGFFTQEPQKLLKPNQQELLEPAINLIQSFEPPGVCVKNYLESLVNQVKRLHLQPQDETNIINLLQNHFENLRPNKFDSLAKTLKLEVEDISAYYELIQSLNPFPGNEFDSSQTSFAIPELSIKSHDGSLVLVMNKAGLPDLELSKDFTSLSDGNKETNKYISDSIAKAKLLISQIELRYTTIYKTALVLMELQRDFFLKGPSFLKPMTMAEVASKVGVHETTISRISQAKYIDTDFGIYSLKQFFTQGLKSTDSDSEDVSRSVVQQKILEIIKANTTEKRLSDQKIADLLQQQGIKIARRTVAKYRAQLNVDSSYIR